MALCQCQPIRLVTFDALYTLVVPRIPVHLQYAQVFEPYLGVLDPLDLKKSFRSAFQFTEKDKLVYTKGSHLWWSQVIKRTAIGAGADENAVDASLSQMVPQLLRRFSSKEGYKAFDDALPAVQSLHEMGIRTAVISNADSRIRTVLHDLEFPSFLHPIILSEEEGVEKPSPEIYRRALGTVNGLSNQEDCVTLSQCLHIGDELDADYHGAQVAGMKALLLRRPGEDGKQAHRMPNLTLSEAVVVSDLRAVVDWVVNYNHRS